MAKYKSERRFSLSFLGDGWKDCNIVFEELSVKEMREMLNKKLSKQDPTSILTSTMDVIKGKFIKGTAPGKDGKLENLTKEDLEELPSRFVNEAITFLVGGSEEKAG